MATYKTGWMKKLINGVSTKIFAISHVKAIYYDYANSKTLKSKLDDMDTSISGKASSTHTHSAATTSAAGFMSAADKTKLNGIATGANKTTVDSALSSTSTNPVQNKVVNTNLGNKMNKADPSGTGKFAMNGSVDGNNSVCFGNSSNASHGFCAATVGGSSNIVSGNSAAIVGGQKNKMQNDCICSGIFGGSSNTLNGAGYSSIVGGYNNSVINNHTYCVVLGGIKNTGNGDSSVVSGYNNETKDYQFVMGHCNNKDVTGTTYWTGQYGGTLLCLGNGTDTTKNNAFRFQDDGNAFGTKWNTSGADYAEFFEWADGNTNNEDRVGYFVTLDGDMIRKAEQGDYILGIVSGAPGVLGNADEQWMGRFKSDNFGRLILETKEVSREIIYPILDEETGEQIGNKTIQETAIVQVPIENENYDSSETYIPRSKRPEWDAVGLMGVLSVYDDGTCEKNGFCKVASNGIATASSHEDGSYQFPVYRVVDRVTENIVKVLFR